VIRCPTAWCCGHAWPPIPFAAVATDIETGERVVMDGGDLVEAMRASMAIPVVFSPVELDGRILVDGGLVDNMPVELARAMGADVVIAVDASPPLLERERLRTVLGISEQVVTLLGRQDLLREMASADVALDIGFEHVGIFDFRDADSIIAKGAAVARDSAGALSAWSVSEAEYRNRRAAVLARRRALPTRPGGLAIDAPDWVDKRLIRARIDSEILDTFDPELAELVDMRYFGGYSEAEIAELQGITDRTVRRRWDKARAWLYLALQPHAPPPSIPRPTRCS